MEPLRMQIKMNHRTALEKPLRWWGLSLVMAALGLFVLAPGLARGFCQEVAGFRTSNANAPAGQTVRESEEDFTTDETSLLPVRYQWAPTLGLDSMDTQASSAAQASSTSGELVPG